MALARLKGVYAHGFGLVPREVMLSPSLTPEAKAIFAYLCAIAGNAPGWTELPREDELLSALKISHVRYLKHRRQLVDAGLVSLSQGKKRTRPGRVLYMNARFMLRGQENAPVSELAKAGSGIFAGGYGTLSRSVMSSRGISIEAKAVYALLASLAPSSVSASRSLEASSPFLASALMSEKRLRPAIGELLLAGVVTRSRGARGRFSPFTYVLPLYEASRDGALPSAENDTAPIKTAENDTSTALNTTAVNTNTRNIFFSDSEKAYKTGENEAKSFAERSKTVEARIEAEKLRREFDPDAVSGIVYLLASITPEGPDISVSGRSVSARDASQMLSLVDFRHVRDVLCRVGQKGGGVVSSRRYMLSCLVNSVADYGASAAGRRALGKTVPGHAPDAEKSKAAPGFSGRVHPSGERAYKACGRGDRLHPASERSRPRESGIKELTGGGSFLDEILAGAVNDLVN